MSQSAIQPNTEFATFEGIVWLAVLVTWGVRSNAAALLGGVSLALLPAITQNYLPIWTSNVTPVLFGLGAVSAAKYPMACWRSRADGSGRLVLHVAPGRTARTCPTSPWPARRWARCRRPAWRRTSRDAGRDRGRPGGGRRDRRVGCQRDHGPLRGSPALST